MSHTLSPIEHRPATEPGALAHYACKCSCGHVVRTTIETAIAREANAHVEYMNRKNETREEYVARIASRYKHNA